MLSQRLSNVIEQGSLRTQQTNPASSPGSLSTSSPPLQEALHQLLAMGFDRDSALQALSRAGNDLTLATNLLLETQNMR